MSKSYRLSSLMDRTMESSPTTVTPAAGDTSQLNGGLNGNFSLGFGLGEIMTTEGSIGGGIGGIDYICASSSPPLPMESQGGVNGEFPEFAELPIQGDGEDDGGEFSSCPTTPVAKMNSLLMTSTPPSLLFARPAHVPGHITLWMSEAMVQRAQRASDQESAAKARVDAAVAAATCNASGSQADSSAEAGLAYLQPVPAAFALPSESESCLPVQSITRSSSLPTLLEASLAARRLLGSDRAVLLDFLSMYLTSSLGLPSEHSNANSKGAALNARVEQDLFESVELCGGEVERLIDCLLMMSDELRPGRVSEVLSAVQRHLGVEPVLPNSTTASAGNSPPFLQYRTIRSDSSSDDFATIPPSRFMYESSHEALSRVLSQTPLVGVTTQSEMEEMLRLAGGLQPLIEVLRDQWGLCTAGASPSPVNQADASSSPKKVEEEIQQLPSQIPSLPATPRSLSSVALQTEAPTVVPSSVVAASSSSCSSSSASVAASASPPPSAHAADRPASPQPLFLTDLLHRLRTHNWPHSGGGSYHLSDKEQEEKHQSEPLHRPFRSVSTDSLDGLPRVPAVKLEDLTDTDRESAQEHILSLGLMDRSMETVVFTADALNELILSAGGPLHLRSLLVSMSRQKNFSPQTLPELAFLLSEARRGAWQRKTQPLHIQIARARREVERQDRAAALAALAQARERRKAKRAQQQLVAPWVDPLDPNEHVHPPLVFGNHEDHENDQALDDAELAEMDAQQQQQQNQQHDIDPFADDLIHLEQQLEAAELNDFEDLAGVEHALHQLQQQAGLVHPPPLLNLEGDLLAAENDDMHPPPPPPAASEAHPKFLSRGGRSPSLSLLERRTIAAKILESHIGDRCGWHTEDDLLSLDLGQLSPESHGYPARGAMYVGESIRILAANGIRILSFAHLRSMLQQHYAHAQIQNPYDARARLLQQQTIRRRKPCVIL